MIKIFLSVRNRLEVTKKCIQALKRHSTIPHQIYVYNNATNYLLEEHFWFFYKLYQKGAISQITFTSETSTFNAFSKASTCNFFGKQHEEDPKKDSYDFLLMLDNDMIVAPEWDKKVKVAWNYLNKNKLKNIKIVTQLPGGMKNVDKEPIDVGSGLKGRSGFLGGSGFWAVRPNFFDDVGFLPLDKLVNQHKRHDQLYWQTLSKNTGGKPYIFGLLDKLAYHTGAIAGSVCNRLTRNRNNKNKDIIKFEEQEQRIGDMNFDDFFQLVSTNDKTKKGW